MTLADTEGNIIKYDLSKATIEKAKARRTKRKFMRGNVRIRKIIYGKYGVIERNRVLWLLHNDSSSIVKHAKDNQLGMQWRTSKESGGFTASFTARAIGKERTSKSNELLVVLGATKTDRIQSETGRNTGCIS
jgi:hypothetical protein